MLSVSLSNLLRLPIGSPDFICATYEMMLEHNHYFAASTASRVLAARALKRDREERGVAKPAGPPVYRYLLTPRLSFDPSLALVVPPLCSTLIFVYRKMFDFEVTDEGSEPAFKRIFWADAWLKACCIGNLSKQLHRLAVCRLSQQWNVLVNSTFAAFTHMEDGTAMPVLAIDVPTTTEEEEDGKGEGPAPPALLPSPQHAASV